MLHANYLSTSPYLIDFEDFQICLQVFAAFICLVYIALLTLCNTQTIPVKFDKNVHGVLKTFGFYQ